MKLFQGSQPKQQAEVPIAPIPDDQIEQANQERDYQRKYGKRGRSGTVLSTGNKLG